MLSAEWKHRIYEIIFEAETPKGKAFDIALIILVISSVIVIMLESVDSFQVRFAQQFMFLEWFFTIIFSLEYIMRLLCVHKPTKYAKSFFGLVDIFSILPTYLSFFFPGLQSLLIIRAFRLLRIFRVLKLSRFTVAGSFLSVALRQSRHKIAVFLGVVLTFVIIIGAVMYLVEGKENGFTSIPKSVYWAIVTMTTVGYGDISPHTPLGQLIASILMISGYGVIAVPTGIVTSEMAQARVTTASTHSCHNCTHLIVEPDAKFCSDCGYEIDKKTHE